ncbi:MAG: UDP-N-acetylmuramoyl-L-alanine--D-glutamate ligase [Candidatus Babeliaceae bacterium]|nr:UDP-N-acetylmuramoyl-L-alanine--D-glutamate ligase [Candidatus Babeliaceae bacterium]
MDLTDKRIGIWGLGVSGRAALSYLSQFKCHLSVLDRTEPEEQLARELKNLSGRSFRDPDERTAFFAANDIIIPSPGIDIAPFINQMPTIFTEVDLFYHGWQKPIIGITGSLGKTTITTFLSHLLASSCHRVATGGNIGVGMLDLLARRTEFDYAILELSSFQLERALFFAPNLAIWTNLYPNHLDRHENLETYRNAKMFITRHQTQGQTILAPIEIAHFIRQTHEEQALPPRYAWFSLTEVNDNTLLQPGESCFYFTPEGSINKKILLETSTILDAIQIPGLSYRTNWLILAAALDLLGQDVPHIIKYGSPKLSLPNNRLACFAHINGIDFYNDSKSTIMEATLAAVNQLRPQPIHLLLGGLSKGVDRSPYLAPLAECASITCFGSEGETLCATCKKEGFYAHTYPDLESALSAILGYAKPGSCILLSPGGTSFDLYKNYEERGLHFIELAEKLTQQKNLSRSH